MLTLHAKNTPCLHQSIVRWQDGPLYLFYYHLSEMMGGNKHLLLYVLKDVGIKQLPDELLVNGNSLTRPVCPTMDWCIAALSICVIFCSLAYNIHSAIPLHLSDLQCDHCPVMAARRSCSTLHGLKALDIARATGGSDRSVMSNGPVNTTDLKHTDREQT